MDLSFTPEDTTFRETIRRFIAESYPKDLKDRTETSWTKDDYLSWHRVLARQGWSVPAWPTEYGGPGWSATQRYIFSEELARADTIPLMPFGTAMVGPVIYTFGTPEQKARFLPGIVSGEDWWCQGYSEPGAGSDLASLRTRADRDGDHYLVNGQKTWTSYAHYANWGFFLVRTDPDAEKPQQGISFLLIDMTSPGVTVRPIITLGGQHAVNEVWLENVRVPVENRIHDENKGWTCAKFLLAHERTSIAGVARSRRGIEKLRAIAATEIDGDRTLIEDPFFRRKIAELEIDLAALEYTELRGLAALAAGKPPGAESSMLKIKGSEIQQRITELALEAAGTYGAPDPNAGPHGDNDHPVGPDHAAFAASNYFDMRKTTIYGGSNEIQRGIIAKMVLGL